MGFSSPRILSTVPTESIALLIDADNAPAAAADFVLSELATHGVVNIRRAYEAVEISCHAVSPEKLEFGRVASRLV